MEPKCRIHHSNLDLPLLKTWISPVSGFFAAIGTASSYTMLLEGIIAPSVGFLAPTPNKRKLPMSEAPKASRPKPQYVERISSGSSRSPQSSPLRQTHNFNYLPRMANSSPLRNDPTMRRLPALPLDITRPSLSNLLYQESASHYDPVTSSSHFLQHNVFPPRTESVRPEEPKSIRRTMAPNRRPHRDAYDAFPASPDSIWTSLPAPAKRRRPATEKRSGNFKIARLLDRKSPEGAIGSTTEFSGSSKITTYLPPPRSEPKPRSDAPREPTRGVTLWNVKRMGHPSAYSSHKSRPEDITPVHSILSSNTQGSHHEDELRLPFNSENLGARYKMVRQAARKVRLMSVLLYGSFFSLYPVAKTSRDATVECSRLAQLRPSFP